MGNFEEEDDDNNLSPKKDNGKKTSKTPVLDNFGKNLTRLAEEGKLDPVYGRTDEVLRVAQILTRRKKNNPIIIGSSGVGKTSIAILLAQMIADKTAPRHLFNKQIIEIDMGSVVSGTKFRGQFEERMKAIIQEVSANTDIILFVDEIHTIIGAGGASGSLDAANMLKPALARGDFQIIGSTTLTEYRQHIEKDPALERRFQKVQLDPTSIEDTIKILNSIKDKYEDHHKVFYTEDAIDACVKLTDRYINDRFLPDKAIDALDEVGSKVHLNLKASDTIKKLEESILNIKKDKNEAVKAQKYEEAATLRDEERKINAQLADENRKWEIDLNTNRIVITEDMVADIVSKMSGVPVTKVNKEEKKSLSDLQNKLELKVIGQKDAVVAAAKAVKRSRTGIKDTDKPLSFMFIGNSGVGKTLLAKALAEELYEGRDSLIRFDMSEYTEKINVSKLIGAAPGYIGFDQGGQLTEAVRRKPYSVVLFDEIEKAHPDIYNIFLQILDEGHATDSHGVKVDFKNTIIIMTSNVGTRTVKQFGTGIGFDSSTVNKNTEKLATITKELNKQFSPEFLNRLDEIVFFKDLDADNVSDILKLEILKVQHRVSTLGYELVVTQAALDFLAIKGYDIQNGARPVKRAIQNHVEDLLSEELVRDVNITVGTVFTIDYDKKLDILNIKTKEVKKKKTNN